MRRHFWGILIIKLMRLSDRN